MKITTEGLYMQKTMSGFTLLEIILILVILGVLTAVAASKYSKFQDEAEDSIVHSEVGIVEEHVLMVYEKLLLETGKIPKGNEVAIAADCQGLSDELHISCGGKLGEDSAVVIVVKDNKGHISFKQFELP